MTLFAAYVVLGEICLIRVHTRTPILVSDACISGGLANMYCRSRVPQGYLQGAVVVEPIDHSQGKPLHSASGTDLWVRFSVGRPLQFVLQAAPPFFPSGQLQS